MIGAIRHALAQARREVEPMIRTRPSGDRSWCYVPTEDIHRASQQAMRGVGLELFLEGTSIREGVLSATYRLCKTEGEGLGHFEDHVYEILIDRGERGSTNTAGALALLERRVRMALLDIVSLPSAERVVAERSPAALLDKTAHSVELNRQAMARARMRRAPTTASPADLAAEADAVFGEDAGMPAWASAEPGQVATVDMEEVHKQADASAWAAKNFDPEPDPIEVWKSTATRAWIEATQVCANAGCDKPDLDAVIRGVAGPRADADDLDASGWSQVVVELGHIKARAVQAIVEGDVP